MKNKQINFRTTQQNYTAIANAAKQMDTSISKLLIRAFWYYCAAMHLEPPKCHDDSRPKPKPETAKRLKEIADTEWVQE